MTIIKPIYPKKILKEPYLNGFYSGLLMGIGIMMVFVNIFTGSLLILLSFYLYIGNTGE